MGIPVTFLTKFAIPLIIAAFTLEGNEPEQSALFATSLKESVRVLSHINEEGQGPTESYDYIIVGAGSAGSVLAKRLTEDGANSVLILEGGGDPTPVSEIPWFQDTLTDPSVGMIFNYVTVPQRNACLNRNGFCTFNRGKALGGSSSVNGLLYNRCNPKDYDLWANFTRDSIWTWNSVLDAFNKIETYNGHYSHDANINNHGSSGEMHVRSFPCTGGCEILLEMFAEYGIPVGDLNSGQFHSGFAKVDLNINNGLRWGTYQGFLEPIIGVRNNLRVYRYAWVTKIRLDEEKKAIGVTYWRHGKIRHVGANKEIILAAGVIDSPKLLMLSGIGPNQHLSEHGIETVVDLHGVGSHLQDHVGLDVHPFAINPAVLGTLDSVTAENINQYLTNAKRDLSSI